MENIILCEFCKKEFSSKGNLKVHQKTTKYCLSLQGKSIKIFDCEYCLKTLTTQQNLQEHLLICKEKIKIESENMSEKMKKSIDRLERKIEKTREDYEEKMEKQKKEHKEELEKQKKEHKEELEKQKKEHKEELEKQKREYERKLEKYEEKYEQRIDRHESNMIAMKPNNVEDNEDEEKNEDLTPLNVYQQLNEVVNTIEPEQEKEEIILSSLTINSITITSRCLDHYINATELCQAGGKLFGQWFRLDSTKELIRTLSSDVGIHTSLLVETKRGQSSNFKQGSWIHPDLAIQLAQWISPSFALQVSRWVRSLFNEGTVIIDLHLLKQQQEEMKAKDQRIKQLEDVCLTKRKRVEYPEQNVIYLLTTEDHLKRRTYIVGKAKNLTNRLSTYNKTCDHTVVHYRACKNEEDMSTAETMVISRLRDFKEQANRDRFVLPETKDVSFFINTIDQCVEFLN